MLQSQLLALAPVVADWDLEGFLGRVSEADTLGPVLDPSLYRAGMDNTHEIKQLAEAALSLKCAVLKLREGAG